MKNSLAPIGSLWLLVVGVLASLPLAVQAGIPIQHWTQAGVRVYLVESPVIPMVDVQIDFDAGSRRDPPGQAGLASVTAAMAGRGVAADGALPALDENGLGEAWADLGASFGASASGDRMTFLLRSVTVGDTLMRAARLAARQLGQPVFPAAIWARERERLSAGLKESRTRPSTIAARAFNAAVYGNHPYGFEMTEASLAAISVDDMARIYRERIQPCRARVSIVGAVDRAGAERLVGEPCSRLGQAPEGGCAPLGPVPEVAPLAAAQDIRIPFDAAQAQVLIGQPGIRRSDPDFYPIYVGNYILGGGGFVSRLNDEVRQKRGLSYSVYSYFSPALHAGAFTLGLQTRPDQATQAVRVAREVVEAFVRDGPTESELLAAKANLAGGFALTIDSNRKLLANVASVVWNGLPLDYLDGWPARVEAVTLAQIRAAFQRHLQPQRMVTVVVGGSD